MITIDHHVAAQQHFADRDYGAVLKEMQRGFDAAVTGGQPLFRTDAAGLFDLYLNSLPTGDVEERQYHNCNCCRRFIENFGGLVTVGEDGALNPVMWASQVDGYYATAIIALRDRVEKAKIVSAFLSSENIWGTPVTGAWTHFAVNPLSAMVYRNYALTAGRAMAANKERRRIVIEALHDFKPALLDEALRVLKANALARSEKFVAPLQWLRDLHDRPKGRAGDNLLWVAVTKAPEGFCHPRSAVTGSLLEDIAAGLPFPDVERRFNAKMHPLQYQRPQAAPSIGNIKAAEELVARLGIAPSLERRYAQLDDLKTLLWKPCPVEEKQVPVGIFGHLEPKNADRVASLNIPAQTMTWEKFARTVLPTAAQIQLLTPHGRGSFIGVTTAVHADAPPILKWDREDERNPIAWYCYNNGSSPEAWGLRGGRYVDVTAITPFPTLTGSRPMPELADGVILVLDGARDSNTGVSNALFPECLKSELHGIRSTIEAYSRSARLHGREEASANGYDLRKSKAQCHLQVFDGRSWNDYRIDRWD